MHTHCGRYVGNGEWEPDPNTIKCKNESTMRKGSLSRDGKIAVASSVTVFTVASILLVFCVDTFVKRRKYKSCSWWNCSSRRKWRTDTDSILWWCGDTTAIWSRIGTERKCILSIMIILIFMHAYASKNISSIKKINCTPRHYYKWYQILISCNGYHFHFSNSR